MRIMLKNEPWVLLGRDIRFEYEQGVLEGRDVEKYRKLCEAIAEMDENTLRAMEPALTTLGDEIAASPMKQDFPYEESSDYDVIVTASAGKGKNPTLPAWKDRESLRHRIKGAWLGRMAGCLLGKPVEGYHRPELYAILKGSDNYPMKKYMRYHELDKETVERLQLPETRFWADTLHDGISPADDDTNYTVLGLKIIERFGRDFSSHDVMQGWLSFLPYLATCTAERVAYRNAAAGMLPPATATYKNPYREWIGAQIRADFYGYVNPGDPITAASMAFRDASISHIKNGIYGAMFVAAMLAAAAVTDSVDDILDAGLSVIPCNCRLKRDVELVRSWYREGLNGEAIIEKIHSCYNENSQCGWCYTNSNAMIVTMALLCGQGDFGKSICLSVQAAFDTDCNGATVGSIVGMMVGDSGIAKEWTEPFGGRLYTGIQGYNLVDAEVLTEKTLSLIPGYTV